MTRTRSLSRVRRSARLHPLLVVALLGALLAAIVPSAGPAHAVTVQLVKTTNDSGPSSLRDLLTDFTDGATIDFDPALAGQTITLTSGELPLLANLTIKNTSGGPITIDGGGHFRVFHAVTSNANARANVTIQDLIIQHGLGESGAGILIDGGSTLTLDGVVVRNNVTSGQNGQSSDQGAPTSGGGPGLGGGIANAGTLTVRNSTVADNQAFGGIGGLGENGQSGAGGGAGLGGGLFNTGTATIVGSAFTGNMANGGLGGIGAGGGGGGAGMGAAIFQGSTGTLKLTNVTLDGNTATGVPAGLSVTVGGTGVGADGAFGFGGGGGGTGGHGGFGGGGGGGAGGTGGPGGGGGTTGGTGGGAGGFGGGSGGSQGSGNGGSGFGGGLFVAGGATVVTSSTISGNKTQTAAGFGLPGPISGGGLYLVGSATSLRATIVAGNTAGAGPDIFGAIVSRGYNLVQTADGASGLAATDKTGQDPGLGPLQVNAPGRGATRALTAGSPAIDGVPLSACLGADDAALVTDQRGAVRPVDGNADGTIGCDLGAYELTAASVKSSTGALDYAENAAPTPVDPGLTIADTGFANLDGATVQIAAGYAPGQDLLGFTPQNGITSTFSPATGTLALTGTATVAQYQTALRTVTYQNGSDAPSTAARTVRYEVRGGGVASNSTVRSVNVTATNDPPVAVDDGYTVAAAQALTVPAASGVLKNDTDVDSSAAALTASLLTNPQHGSVTLNLDGGFTYTPAGGFAGTDSFTYRASDGSAQSNAATVTITVTPTACAPRPRVQTSPTAGGGKLQVHVEATPLNTAANNPLQELRFGVFQNAKVTIGGQLVASGQTYTVQARTVTIDFTVERAAPGQATTVPFTVVDGCGQWQTFVGGGAGAGF